MKGADSKIYELLRPDPNDANRAVTSERLKEFSRYCNWIVMYSFP